MRKFISVLLITVFFSTNTLFAASTNFNSQSAKFYLVCPYCAKVTKLQTDVGVDKKCSNEKCGERLDSQSILSSGDEAYKFAKQIKGERIKKAASLNIKEDSGVKCRNCMRNEHMDQFEILAIVEGGKSRTIICKGCGQTYNFIDGVNFYEIEKQKEQRAIMKGIAIAGAVALVGVAAVAASKGGGGGGYYKPPPVSIPQSVSYNNPAQVSYTPAARPIMPISQGGNYTMQKIGNFDYVNGSNGYSGTGQRIGNFYYYNDNQGGSYSTQSTGKFDYTSGSNGYSGSGQQLGKFYYYNDNRGGNYTGQRIGNFDYVSGSNGYSGTGQRIGNLYYYNDNK